MHADLVTYMQSHASPSPGLWPGDDHSGTMVCLIIDGTPPTTPPPATPSPPLPPLDCPSEVLDDQHWITTTLGVSQSCHNACNAQNRPCVINAHTPSTDECMGDLAASLGITCSGFGAPVVGQETMHPSHHHSNGMCYYYDEDRTTPFNCYQMPSTAYQRICPCGDEYTPPAPPSPPHGQMRW